MNGFAHTILSLLLSWIRALISNVWALINSEDGGMFYRFLSGNWLLIVLVLCLGGVAIDLVVYFFRWRPYYVWRSKLRSLRSRRRDEGETFDPPPFQEPADGAPVLAYTPVQQPAAVYPSAAAYASEPALEDPVFDDEAAIWEEAAQPLQTDWPENEPFRFGAARQDYDHDIQAGYAPPVPPDQLYAPSASYQSPVHPGLGEDVFRQSFGLQTDEEARQERYVVHAPAFRPFTVVDEDAEPAKENPFARFAKRARALVGVEDEDHQPSIHDLQSTVDVSQAFHAPVYPQPMDHYKEG